MNYALTVIWVCGIVFLMLKLDKWRFKQEMKEMKVRMRLRNLD